MKVWRSTDDRVVLYLGDCREVLPTLREPLHACVTDPPYGLEFMGKDWDAPWKFGFSAPGYGDAERLVRPSFSSSRNPICLECGKRQRTWAGGPAKCTCGRPRWDVSPADEKAKLQAWFQSWLEIVLGTLLPGAPLLAFGGTRTWHRLGCAIEDAGFELRDTIMWLYGQGFPKSLDISKAVAAHKVCGKSDSKQTGTGGARDRTGQHWSEFPKKSIKTEEARPGDPLWNGYGTALKPAHEPILLAMRPLGGTFAENALAHGVAGLNIDGCRVPTDESLNGVAYAAHGAERHDGAENWRYKRLGGAGEYVQPTGRWPANVVHDGSDEVEEAFAQFGEHKSGGVNAGTVRKSTSFLGKSSHESTMPKIVTNSGSVSRFFYCAKASRAERTCDGAVENKHATVKPLDLMRWLVRLVSMPGGSTVLDPFMGSGTTGMAAVLEGQRFIGIEKDEESFNTAVARIEHALGVAGVGGEAESEEPAVDFSGVCWGEDNDDEQERSHED